MAAKTYLERTVETIVDFQANHERNMRALTQQVEKFAANVTALEQATNARMERIERAIEANSQAISQNNSAIVALRASIERLAMATETQKAAIDGHLEVAKQQSQNISELTRLVATQAQTVNRLLERVAVG